MKSWNSDKIIVRMLAVAVLLVASPTLHGQHITTDTLAKAAPWLGKSTLQKLKAIAEWQEGETDSLHDAAAREPEKRNGREQAETEKMPSPTQYPDRSQVYDIYSQCDTSIIRLYKDLCGDDELKKLCDALLLLHKYEGVLQKPYNSSEVSRARKAIKLGKEVAPDVYDNIDRRLEQYAAMNENLRYSLSEANGEKFRPAPDTTRARHMKEEYTKDFFTELEKHLDLTLLDANAYPYLYGILQEAIAVKMNDPSNNIQNLIDKL